MIRRFSFLALTLLVTASSVAAAEDEGSVFMWKAQKDGAAVYLLGSVHALKEESYPLPAVIEAAFDQSGRRGLRDRPRRVGRRCRSDADGWEVSTAGRPSSRWWGRSCGPISARR